MEIVENFDPETKKILLNVSSALLNKYYSNFSGFLRLEKELPKGMEVTRISSSEAQISFPILGNSIIEKVESDRVRLGVKLTGNIISTINRFVNSALRHEYRTVEFLPIDGTDYPIESLKEDIKSAIKGKRNLILLHTHKEFLNVTGKRGRTIEYNQIYISYENDASTYANIALMILNDDMKSLREWAKPRFKVTSWV